ncbi:hypothetical protein Tco_0538035 [Tanacetum coccineum]
MEKYPSISKRLNEPYNTIKDDTPLSHMYTIREVTEHAMEISDDLLADEINATRKPNPKSAMKKKMGKQVVGESCTPKKSLKIRIKQRKSTPTTPIPPIDDVERYYLIEATQLSLVVAKTAKKYEAQPNVALVESKILEEDVEKLVDGEEESDDDDFANTIILSYEDPAKTAKEYDAQPNVALVESKILEKDVEKLVDVEEEFDDDDFADTMILSYEDPSTRLELRSRKENLGEIVDDDKTYVDKNDDPKDDDDNDNDDDDHNDHALIRTRKMDKAHAKELTNIDVPMSDAPSQPTSSHHTHLKGIVVECVEDKIVTSTTNELVKDNLPWLMVDAVKKEREQSKAEVLALISQEFAAHAPKITEELFKIHMKNTVFNVHPTSCASTASIPDLQQQLYLKMKYDLQSQVADSKLWNFLNVKYEMYSASTDSCRFDAFHKQDHDNHPDDDALPEGEKSAKRQKTSRGSKSASGSSSK